MNLDILKDKDNLEILEYDEKKVFIHEDHRWVLPIIFHAQEEGLLEKPCDIIMFDYHHDSIRPKCMERIHDLYESGVTFENLIDLCNCQELNLKELEYRLNWLDDDWIIAGMELGIIDNLVAFGVKEIPDDLEFEINNIHKDFQGNEHRLHYLSFLDHELRYHGRLSDRSYCDSYSGIWEILNWHYKDEIFSFGSKSKKILLDIDLDCFRFEKSGFYLPWPKTTFEQKFLAQSDYNSTKGWTGKQFFKGLIQQAGIITIAMESECCGGKEKSNKILQKLNSFLFDNKIKIQGTRYDSSGGKRNRVEYNHYPPIQIKTQMDSIEHYCREKYNEIQDELKKYDNEEESIEENIEAWVRRDTLEDIIEQINKIKQD